MKNLFKYNKYAVLRLVVLVRVFEYSIGEIINMKFKVTDDDCEASSHSIEIAKWEVRGELECYLMCGTMKGCQKVEFDEDAKICTAYGDSNTDSGLQRTPGTIVTNKVIKI